MPQGIAPPLARYAHGVEIAAGARLVRTAGQLAVAPDGSVPEGAGPQAALIFANIAAILAEAGMSARHICHISAYLTDAADLPAYMAARDAFLAGTDVLPSSTLLLVAGFTRPWFKVEIEVWAAA
jgi:enamine deaminase RidA (YjgF/YER057c/UK114 family)